MFFVAGGHTGVNYDADATGFQGEPIGGIDDWHGDFAVGGAKFAAFHCEIGGGSADQCFWKG